MKRKASNENFSSKWGRTEADALEERLKDNMFSLVMKASNIYLDASSFQEDEVNGNHVDGQLAMREAFFKKYFRGESFTDWNQSYEVPDVDGIVTFTYDADDVIGQNLDILAGKLSVSIAGNAASARQKAMLRC